MSDNKFLTEMGLRIKNCRMLRGLTQSELAEKAGYKEKSSIAHIERGEVDIPQSKIEVLARALDCTPAYIMGWARTPDGVQRSEHDEALLNRLMYSLLMLNPEGQNKLLERAEELQQLPQYSSKEKVKDGSSEI